MTVALLHLLAAEGPTKANIWNPTIIGILTVVSAVGLFCGSVYLLLGTNLGARLGFLVAAAGLTGFMVLLTTLWWTSGSSGIDPPHGHSPQWTVVDVTSAPPGSKVTGVHDITTKGKAVTSDQLTNLKPAMDAALVTPTSLNGETPPARPFAKFDSSTGYLVDFPGYKSYLQGGGTKNVFWHHPKLAAVQFCVAEANVTPPKCDPLKDTQYAILEFDYGTLRQPVVIYFFMSLALFGLSVLGLYWWELDERDRQRAATVTPVPTTTSS